MNLLNRSFAAVGRYCREGEPGWTWWTLVRRLLVLTLTVATLATIAGVLGDGPRP